MTRHLQDLLAASADRHADRPALVGVDETLTYAELDAAVNRVAHVLLAHGLTPGARVCVLAEKAPWTVAALIGTLRAGGAYVPVDPAGPASRVARIVGAAEPEVVLVDAGSRALLDEVLAELPGPLPVVGAIDDAPAAFTRADLLAAPADAPGGGARRPRAPALHLRLHRRAQGRDDHPRHGARVRGLGAAPLRREAR